MKAGTPPDRDQRQLVVDRIMQFLNILRHGPLWESGETYGPVLRKKAFKCMK